MGTFKTAGIILLCVFASGLAGGLIRPRLPQHHLSSESKDLLKQGLAIVGTMTALVLGLLVASAKSSFDGESAELTKFTANVVVIDRVLAAYGPEANAARGQLRRYLDLTLERGWGKSQATESSSGAVLGGGLVDAVQHLSPQNENQRWSREWVLRLLVQLGTSRWTFAAEQASPMQWPFLFIVVFWLTLIFFGMGLMSPPNATTVAVLGVCALATAGALLLVLELYNPLHGLIRLSPAPLKMALSQLGR
jgi:hypothetical protein